jgi:hypothetical protein
LLVLLEIKSFLIFLVYKDGGGGGGGGGGGLFGSGEIFCESSRLLSDSFFSITSSTGKEKKQPLINMLVIRIIDINKNGNIFLFLLILCIKLIHHIININTLLFFLISVLVSF